MKTPGQASRGRILIIDDHHPTRYIFRRTLTRAGFEVEEAETGADGLALAMHGPDIIVCDVNLPDMLGYDVCRRLKSNPATVGIPVLQISASFTSNESKVQALEGGADSYLTLPVDPTVLIAQTNALLRLGQAESNANLAARQWQGTFDSLSDGVVLLNAEGTIVRANRTFLDMLGLVTSAVEGWALSDIFDRTFGVSLESVLSRYDGGKPLELRVNKRWFRLRYDEMEPDAPMAFGSMLLLTEITDQKKLEETLKFNDRLVATGRLAHVIAHEINNPLEAMSNLLFLAEQTSRGTGETHGYVVQASQELLRIGQITKQVLAYHRESKGPVATRAGEIMSEVLAIFRAHILSNKVNLETRFTSSRQILVNPGEFRQVFGNLISNSLDAMGDGGMLRIRCFDTVDPRSERRGVRFLFSDSGAGIAESVLPRIFDAFYTTKGLQGSGVGLWVSAEIVSKHNGYIRVRSRTVGPYRGTLFAIFVPALVQTFS